MKNQFQSTRATVARFQTVLFLFRLRPRIQVPPFISPSKNPHEVVEAQGSIESGSLRCISSEAGQSHSILNTNCWRFALTEGLDIFKSERFDYRQSHYAVSLRTADVFPVLFRQNQMTAGKTSAFAGYYALVKFERRKTCTSTFKFKSLGHLDQILKVCEPPGVICLLAISYTGTHAQTQESYVRNAANHLYIKKCLTILINLMSSWSQEIKPDWGENGPEWLHGITLFHSYIYSFFFFFF